MKQFRIGDGDAGISATVKLMESITFSREGTGSPWVRSAAIDAIRGVQRGQDEIASVLRWVKDHIEFRGEYAETLQTPQVTLDLGAGDCDDHSTLIAAMLESIGFQTRFVTIATGKDEEFSHVYPEVFMRGLSKWIPLDSTVRSSYPGWQPSNIVRRKVRASRPAAMRGDGIGHDLCWLFLGMVATSWLLKSKRR
jgi:hypothetical protein